MSYEYYIGVIDDESVLVECGPMRLVIRAWNRGIPRLQLAQQAAEQSLIYLEQIARCRPELSRPYTEIETPPPGALAVTMVQSVETVGDEDLTPMAAVAGTIADAVADWLFEREVTKVIVDNGGDISIRMHENETVSVGIRPQATSSDISHVLCLDAGRRTYGVTTSGMGGRSFTRGIASAVTVLAATASVADAASTAIANDCFVEDERIVQLPAEKIDVRSDLAGTYVTVESAPLGPEKTSMAIENARKKAENLTQKKAIIGAFIALERQFVFTDGMQPFIYGTNKAAG